MLREGLEKHIHGIYHLNSVCNLNIQMLFDCLEPVYASSVGLQAYISWRLLKEGKKINFINLYLTVYFLINTFNASIHLHLLFRLGRKQFFQKGAAPGESKVLCEHYISSWVVLHGIGGVPNLGIMFCRFIYVRYSHGLVEDMGKLFHKIVVLALSVFTLQIQLMWPIQAAFSDYDYTENAKGRICNKVDKWEEENFISNSVKPKMIICFISGWYAFFIFYMTISARKHSAKYSIPRRRCNAINMTQHCILSLLYPFLIMIDQIINAVVQVFYSSLGPDLVFQIWWLYHLLMFSILNILAPLVIYYIAWTQYPEFSGLRARRFPGQEKPRMGKILPRRYLEHQISTRDPSIEEHPSGAQSSRLESQSRYRKVEPLTIVDIENHPRAQSCVVENHSRNRKVESFTIVDIH